MAFEWIGKDNYLGERVPKSGKRRRGANVTSADAAVMFDLKDGQRHIVLIEWKYTESYTSTNIRYSKRGTDRSEIYRPLYDLDRCPIRRSVLPSYDALFYDPFDQFFRQQLLASEMEHARDLNADVVSVLHIAPKANRDFLRVTSPKLSNVGESAVEVWKRLVTDGPTTIRFRSVHTEELFSDPSFVNLVCTDGWFNYLSERYAWLGS